MKSTKRLASGIIFFTTMPLTLNLYRSVIRMASSKISHLEGSLDMFNMKKIMNHRKKFKIRSQVNGRIGWLNQNLRKKKPS